MISTSSSPPAIVNVAAYRFAVLNNLIALRDELRTLCLAHQLRGTILLSVEGINLFIAGTRQDVDALLSRVRAVPGLENLVTKESLSRERPFNRMLVKIKREIIAFGVNGIDPRRRTSKRLPPTDFKRWLDEGKRFTLFDTRNNFEVAVGTFTGARHANIDDFRTFPEAVQYLPDDLKRTPVVTFCTGGIRCEKAAPFLEQAGFTDVYQLDGGILNYFQTCGHAHFQGHCFVFDKRVALDANLNESDLKQCFACQAILSKIDQASAHYAEGVSCPYCVV